MTAYLRPGHTQSICHQVMVVERALVFFSLLYLCLQPPENSQSPCSASSHSTSGDHSLVPKGWFDADPYPSLTFFYSAKIQ